MKASDTVVDQTARAIRRAIRDGRFAPGQRLVVADLTRMLDVSAGPVREAFSRLAGEGLVEVTAHRGASVRAYSSDEVLQIFDVREAVEGLMARLAAEAVARSAEARQQVVDALEEMHQIVRHAPASFIDHNHRFHEMIYALAGNRRARAIAESLTLPLYRLRFHDLMGENHIGISAKEHDAIGDAIVAGDGDCAERAMRMHIRHSAEEMVAALAKRA